MAQPGKLSFILPVTFREKLSPGARAWRHASDETAVLRTRLALASFLEHFTQDDLSEFIVASPADEMAVASEILASLTRDPRYRVVDELDVCPDITRAIDPRTGAVNGWYAQQLIKLSAAQRVSSEHYVTLDSDVLCLRPFSHASLVRDGRALTNLETISDYERIYTPEFAATEVTIKHARYGRAAEFLAYRRPQQQAFYGETPVVLHAPSVVELMDFLTARFRQPWTHTLGGRLAWTEYSLYFQFLEMTGRLESVCALAGCNAVLDLEKSVWHRSERYRHVRPYDTDHFSRSGREDAGGYFVAIQSWLPVSSWLPARCRTLRDFYREIEEWLLRSDGRSATAEPGTSGERGARPG